MNDEKPKQQAPQPEAKSTNANPNKWLLIGILAGIVAIVLLLVAAGGVAVVVFVARANKEAEEKRSRKIQDDESQRNRDLLFGPNRQHN